MSVAIATILSEGSPLDPRYQLLSLEVTREVNRIPDARLVLLDGSTAQRRFAISDTPFFEPGKKIEIRLRYEGGDEATVFVGLVVRHGVHAGPTGLQLRVELKDAAIRLTHRRRSAVHRDRSDHAVISKIVEDAGLALGSMEATEPTHRVLVQYRSTDWDFILSRADVQGRVVVVHDGTVSLVPMALPEGADFPMLELGLTEIHDLSIEADVQDRPAAFEGVAWSISDQALTPSATGKSVAISPGNLDADAIAEAVGGGIHRLVHGAPLDPDELQAWADARMARSRLSTIRGHLVVPGRADLAPMGAVILGGIGDRFDGTALISGVRHTLTQDGWQTELTLGLSPEWFSRTPDVAEPEAAGLLPPVTGLQVGVVADFEEDPEKELRARVVLPGLDDEDPAIWARLAMPHAGKERGIFFWPEPGDEVVVGFFNNDPRQAVILGAMFSSVHPPPEAAGTPSEDNVHECVVTKGGTVVGFVDEDKPRVFVETAAKNKVLLDDDAQTIQLTDQHGNQIVMGRDGITLKTVKDFVVDAEGNVEISGSDIHLK